MNLASPRDATPRSPALALALAASVACLACPSAALAAQSKGPAQTHGQAAKAQAGAKAKPDGGGPTDTLEQLRLNLLDYQLLLLKEDQSKQLKSKFEQRLAGLKKKPPSGQMIDNFVREREIDSLQRTLHLAIEDGVRLHRQKERLVGELIENSTVLRETLSKRHQEIQRSLAKESNADVSGRLRAQGIEFEHYIGMLQDLQSDPKNADSILTGPWGDSTVLRPSVSPSSRNSGGALARRRPWSVLSNIRRLEREQENLIKIYVQNESALRELRVELRENPSEQESATGGGGASQRPGQASQGPATARRLGPPLPAPLVRPEKAGELTVVGAKPAPKPAPK